jgi:hypothetical protein
MAHSLVLLHGPHLPCKHTSPFAQSPAFLQVLAAPPAPPAPLPDEADADEEAEEDDEADEDDEVVALDPTAEVELQAAAMMMTIAAAT